MEQLIKAFMLATGHEYMDAKIVSVKQEIYDPEHLVFFNVGVIPRGKTDVIYIDVTLTDILLFLYRR